MQYKQACFSVSKGDLSLQSVWMSQDGAHAVRTMKQTADVMPASADINTLKPKNNSILYAGAAGARV